MAQTQKPPPAGSDQSLGDLVALAAKDVSQLVRSEIALAKTEIRADMRRAGIAGALLGVCAFVGCLMMVMLCFAFAYGLMTIGIWSWASFLVVAGACLLLIGIAALVALVGLRGLTKLRDTRKTVQQAVTTVRHGGERRGLPATDSAVRTGQGSQALPGQGNR